MGKGGGGSTTTSTSSNTPPPDVTAQYDQLIAQANAQSAQLLQQYQGNIVAGLTNYQNQAGNEVAGLQGANQPIYNQAQGLIQNASQQITPQTVNAADIAQYQSPYTQNVLNTTMAAENQQDAAQQAQVQGNAISQGAWGGDRSAVAQALTAGQQAIANNATNAGIENQGYSQALGEANTQQQAGLSAQEASQYLGQQGGNALTNLGTIEQNSGLNSASALNSVGAQQQQVNQQQLNVPYEQFQQAQAFPYQNLSWLSSLSTGLGSNLGGTSNSSTTQPAPNSIFGFKRGGHVEGLIKRLASGGAIMMPEHYADGGGSMIPGAGFDLSQQSGMPNLDPNIFSGDPMTLTRGNGVPAIQKATPQQQPSAMQQASQAVGIASGLNSLGGGSVISSLYNSLPSIGGVGGATESISPALAAADPSLLASGAGASGMFSSIGPMLDSIGSGLGSLFSFLEPAAPALAAAARGGRIESHARGGLVKHYDTGGGLTPFDTTDNPVANNQASQFANMSAQQLQQALPRLPAQYRQIAQKVLQQKQVMPNAAQSGVPQAPTAPQGPMARGGLIKHYATDGAVTDDDSAGLLSDQPAMSPMPLAMSPMPPAMSPENAANMQSLYGDQDNSPSAAVINDDKAATPTGSAQNADTNVPAPTGLIKADGNKATPENTRAGYTPTPIPQFHDDKPINDVSPWLSVAAGVAGALAGKSPYILQNVAAGALGGLENYGAQKKESADETYKAGTIQDARNQMIREAEQHNADASDAAYRFQKQQDLDAQKQAEMAQYHQGELGRQNAALGLQRQQVEQGKIAANSMTGQLYYTSGENQGQYLPNQEAGTDAAIYATNIGVPLIPPQGKEDLKKSSDAIAAANDTIGSSTDGITSLQRVKTLLPDIDQGKMAEASRYIQKAVGNGSTVEEATNQALPPGTPERAAYEELQKLEMNAALQNEVSQGIKGRALGINMVQLGQKMFANPEMSKVAQENIIDKALYNAQMAKNANEVVQPFVGHSSATIGQVKSKYYNDSTTAGYAIPTQDYLSGAWKKPGYKPTGAQTYTTSGNNASAPSGSVAPVGTIVTNAQGEKMQKGADGKWAPAP